MQRSYLPYYKANANMIDLIYTDNGKFTSIREPYIHDKFVATHYRSVGDASKARERFKGFLDRRPLIDVLLRELARDDGQPVRIVDCGVFMGIFTIAASLKAAAVGADVKLSAYEANSMLVDPIRANLKLFGVEAEVFANGIGGEYGTLQFVHATHGLIGGSVANPTGKMKSADGYVTIECQIVPLSAILADEMAHGLVKIDIEGYEVAAFRSIVGDAARLNNVFFVEFAPFQAKGRIGGTDYGTFLLDSFNIFEVNNWLWVPFIRHLTTRTQLETCLEVKSNRAFNTDLLFVPKSMRALTDVMTGLITMQ